METPVLPDLFSSYPNAPMANPSCKRCRDSGSLFLFMVNQKGKYKKSIFACDEKCQASSERWGGASNPCFSDEKHQKPLLPPYHLGTGRLWDIAQALIISTILDGYEIRSDLLERLQKNGVDITTPLDFIAAVVPPKEMKGDLYEELGMPPEKPQAITSAGAGAPSAGEDIPF